jgi:hypothetical protein
MAKEKLKIIELDLGIDIDNTLQPMPIRSETKQQITETIKLAKLEQDAINKLRTKKKHKEQKQLNTIIRCYKALYDSTKNNTTISASELIKISETDNLSGLIIRLNNYIKKRGTHYKIKKKRIKGQTHYTLTPL